MSLLRSGLAAVIGVTPPAIVRVLGRPYIAGPTLEDALAVAHGLAAQGTRTTLDLLGEGEVDEATAAATLEEYERALARLADEGLDAGVSVKLSALGQDASAERCLERLLALATAAAIGGRFVRVDMEDSSTTDSTLRIYRQARAAGHDNVGIVLQAALRRTPADLAALIDEGIADVRICKGIYVEPYDVAHRDADAIRGAFSELVELALAEGGRVGIATHDDRLIEAAGRSVRRHDPDRERHEYQALLGVRPELVAMLRGRGERVRVYVPYGKDAERYATRRVQENPRVALYVLRALAPRLDPRRRGGVG